MGKILKVISDGILILTIIILSLYFVLRIANVIRIYNVETGSMEDKIHANDYILLFRKSDYYVGDVVTFKVNDYFITHRIIRIKDDKVTTKGDANNSEDSEIRKDQIEGKAIYWGGILNFIIDYKFVVISFLIGMYLLSCYFDDGKKKSKKKEVINREDEELEKEEISINDIKEEEIKEESKKITHEIIIDEYEENEPIKEQEEVLIDKKEEIAVNNAEAEKEILEIKDIEPIKIKKETKKTTTKNMTSKAQPKKTVKSKTSSAKAKKTTTSKTSKTQTKKSTTTNSKSSKVKSTSVKTKATDKKKSSNTKSKK